MQAVLFVLVISLTCVTLADQSGFIFGNPSDGSIKFIDEQTSHEKNLFDTLVSRPSSVCIDNSNEEIIFANNALPVYAPWISSVPINEEEAATMYLAGENNAPTAVTIAEMAFDTNSNSLFFMYKEINPQKHPFANQTYAVIQRSIAGGDPFPVYTLNVSAKVPNSFAIDMNETLYYSTNGVSHGGYRVFGGIYSIEYNGNSPRQVIDIDELADPSFSVSSVQYSNNQLFYIVTQKNSTGTQGRIYKYNLNSKIVEPVYNKTTFVPVQIVTVDFDDGTNIWVRTDNGDFYHCDSEDCNNVQSPTVSVETEGILDFAVSADESFLYYVGTSVSAVLSVDTSTNSVGSSANGISGSTSIWASDSVVYYADQNRIDGFRNTSGSSEWFNFGVFSFTIDMMTGDSQNSDILFVVSNDASTIYSIQSGDASTLVSTQATAITASSGNLYYASNDEEGSQIWQCTYTDCNPETIFTSPNSQISTLQYDEQAGQLYYGSSDGIFTIGSNSALVPFVDNIMPFALAFDYSRDMIYFLDIDISQEMYSISSCNVSDCTTTENIFSDTISSSSKFELNAWMVITSDGSKLYWVSTSIVGKVYQTDIASGENTVLVDTSEQILGISLSSNDMIIFISDGKKVTEYNIADTSSPVHECTSFNNGYPIGEIELTDDAFYWSDLATGSIYQCSGNCLSCNESLLVDEANPACSIWQFITVYENNVYNQYGCGGIVEVPADGSEVTLKEKALDPISDLIVRSEVLYWALPYRYTIVQASSVTIPISSFETLYSGTGVFENLVVNNDGAFYWIDSKASKINKANSDGTVSDFVFEPAVGLTLYSVSTAMNTTSATPQQSPSMLPSSPSTPVSPSILPSVSPASPSVVATSISASVAVSPSVVNVSASVAASPSVSNNVSASVTASASVAISPNVSATPVTPINSTMTASVSPTISTTASESPSKSYEASVSATVSPTVSNSVTPSNTPSPGSPPSDSSSVSPSITPSPTLSDSSSNTASTSVSSSLSASTSVSATNSLSFGASPSNSPSGSASPSDTPSVSATNFFYGSESNIPYLPYGNYSSYDEPLISNTQWEWIGVITFFIVVLCVIPSLYCIWKRGVEREMAMSLRLPDE